MRGWSEDRSQEVRRSVYCIICRMRANVIATVYAFMPCKCVRGINCNDPCVGFPSCMLKCSMLYAQRTHSHHALDSEENARSLALQRNAE